MQLFTQTLMPVLVGDAVNRLLLGHQPATRHGNDDMYALTTPLLSARGCCSASLASGTLTAVYTVLAANSNPGRGLFQICPLQVPNE